MDSSYIQSNHILDRYLSGELTVNEARQFEQYCLDHPQALKNMPIPARLKDRLAKEPRADSETGMFRSIPSGTTHAAAQIGEEGFGVDEEEAWRGEYGAGRRSRVLVTGLLIALLAALGGVAFYVLQVGKLNKQLQSVQREIKSTAMQAPSGAQTHRLQLARNKPSGPTLPIGWLEPPQLLELRIDPGHAKYSAYQITIDKPDGTRVLRIRRLARDSNKELRLALNSSAFGPGDYLMKFEGYTWRGKLEEVGWMWVGLQ